MLSEDISDIKIGVKAVSTDLLEMKDLLKNDNWLNSRINTSQQNLSVMQSHFFFDINCVLFCTVGRKRDGEEAHWWIS